MASLSTKASNLMTALGDIIAKWIIANGVIPA
jgi:hypothetical protein